MENLVKAENRKWKSLLINLFYDDFNRMLILILSPILIIAATIGLGIITKLEVGANVPVLIYVSTWFSLMLFNDYENLNKIGLSVHRKPLEKVVVNGILYYKVR